MPKIFTSKVVVVGDGAVGKTSLLLKYSKNTFFDNYKPTLGADFIIKEEKLDNDDQFHLYLWDLAGNPSFAILRSYYMHGANGALVCFDVNNPKSFESVSNWIADVYRIRSSSTPIIIVGTKSDIEQKISEEEIKKLCDEKKVPYMATSAKEGKNVREVFLKIISMIMDKSKED